MKFTKYFIGFCISIGISGNVFASNTFLKPSKQLECLTEALYYEARGESLKGILAVSYVILNRVKSQKYPNSICKVVNQQMVKGIYQFSYLNANYKQLRKLPKNKNQYKVMKEIAKLSVKIYLKNNKYDLTKGSMYYYNPDVVIKEPSWASSSRLEFVKKIGQHKFYKRVY